MAGNLAGAIDGPAESPEQIDQLGVTPVHVTDDVERAGQVALVRPEPLANHLDAIDLVNPAQDVHLSEALAVQVADRTAQRRTLVADHVIAEGAIRSRRVPFAANLGGHIEHDRIREDVVVLGQLHDRPAVLGPHTGRVDHRDPSGLEPLGGNGVQDRERCVRGALIVLVVADQPAAEVGGDDLGGQEVSTGERRLARAGHADERDGAQLRNGDPHRVNTAICVGLPRASSVGPMPAIVTE
jgi:hypothetical protein